MHATRTLTSLVMVAGLAVSLPSIAGDVYVIVNNASALTGDEVKDVFLGEKQVVSGAKAVPVDNASLQKDFFDKVVKVDSAKYASIWAKKGFRDGLNAPAVKGSDADVIAVVKSTPGAVGYVSSAPAGVKVVQKF